jgi:threonine dehydrogenase-like Zn-dependent dehydrogenase
MESDEVSPLTLIGKECEVKASLGGMELFRTARDLLAAGLIKAEPMITRVISLAELDAVCQELGTKGDDNVKVLVAPGRR